jgi:hypothetical protein
MPTPILVVAIRGQHRCPIQPDRLHLVLKRGEPVSDLEEGAEQSGSREALTHLIFRQISELKRGDVTVAINEEAVRRSPQAMPSVHTLANSNDSVGDRSLKNPTASSCLLLVNLEHPSPGRVSS